MSTGMFEFITAVQIAFIDQLGFAESPKSPGLPLHVPDGVYNLTINGNEERIEIRNGYIILLD